MRKRNHIIPLHLNKKELAHLEAQVKISGLGGRSISKADIDGIFDELLSGTISGKQVTFVNLRRDLCGSEC